MLLLTKKSRLRFRVRLRKFFKTLSVKIDGGETKLNDIQIEAINIVKKMIVKPEATLLIAPISSICYIEWKHYFVRFGESALTITNGKFSYYIWLPSRSIDSLRENFYRNVELRRKNMEVRYDKRTLENMKSISNEVRN
jgi:hypothetical protein